MDQESLVQVDNPISSSSDNNLDRPRRILTRKIFIIFTLVILIFLFSGVGVWAFLNDKIEFLFSTQSNKQLDVKDAKLQQAIDELQKSSDAIPSSTSAFTSPTASSSISSIVPYQSKSDIYVLSLNGRFNRVSEKNFSSQLFSSKLSSLLLVEEKIVEVNVSPDSSKVLIEGTRSFPDHTNITNLNGGKRYFIVSEDGNDVELIDTVSITDALKDTEDFDSQITFYGWSIDSKKLIAHISMNSAPDRITGEYPYKKKTLFIEYDLVSQIPRKLLSFRQKNNEPPILGAGINSLFYDSDAQVLAYSLPVEGKNSEYKLVVHNLKTNSKVEYDLLTMVNSYQTSESTLGFNSKNMAVHQYFASANISPVFTPGGSNAYNSYTVTYTGGDKLSIYSYYNPTKPIATITLDEPPEYAYTNFLLWSRDGEYFAVLLKNTAGTSGSKNSKIKIYTRTGDLVSTVTLEKTSLGIFGAFSTDNKYILLFNLLRSEIIEVSSGSIVSKKVSLQGTPVFWRRD